MSNERIDLTQFEGLDIDREIMHFQSIIEEIPNLLAELKRCYDLIDTFYPPPGLDVWGEDLDHPRHEWEEEVVATNVNAGYWHWVSNEKQRLASE